MIIDWTEFRSAVERARNVIVVGHIRPDGDTIGSLLAMKRALTQLGKRVLLLDGHSVPPSLKFADPSGDVKKIALTTREERAFAASADLVMALDVSSWAQLGPDASEYFKPGSNGVKVVIDHHAVADQIGDARFVDPDSDSAGSLVFEAIKALGVPFTKEIAEPLYVAIASDTGWFRFQTTNAGTFRRAAELVEAGVNPAELYRELYEQETYGRFKLLGELAGGAERFLDGRGVFMRLSQEDFAKANAAMTDSEDLVNLPLSVAGTEVSVLAVQQKDGSVKASFRSRCALDCAVLAREFGGGGHARAAGATCQGDFEAACFDFKLETEKRYAALKR